MEVLLDMLYLVDMSKKIKTIEGTRFVCLDELSFVDIETDGSLIMTDIQRKLWEK